MGTMRIIGGEYKGRRLKSPALGTRPTSGQLREALFNILGDVSGMEMLELFAGTGAVGLEALSRGAAHVTFVEQGRAALKVLRDNIALLSAHNRATLVGKEALATCEKFAHEGRSFDLIFADPPYGKSLGQEVLSLVDSSHLLTDKGLLYIEEGGKGPPLVAENLMLRAERHYGDSTLFEYGK
jgi:16S rRNA (guanine966-N2)-methyltransferase